MKASAKVRKKNDICKKKCEILQKTLLPKPQRTKNTTNRVAGGGVKLLFILFEGLISSVVKVS